MRSNNRKPEIRIQLSPEEKEALKQLAAARNLTLTRLVRMVLFEGTDLNRLRIRVNPLLLSECRQGLRALVASYSLTRLVLVKSEQKEIQSFLEQAESLLHKFQTFIDGK